MRLLSAMSDVIARRGPDGEGLWSDPAAGVYLAHRRLKIIDLSDAGTQPIATGHDPPAKMLSINSADRKR